MKVHWELYLNMFNNITVYLSSSIESTNTRQKIYVGTMGSKYTAPTRHCL